MSAPALVIGLGNPDRGDDAVGLHVARQVAALGMPGVAVMEAEGDMLALLDRWAGATRVLVVDAAMMRAAVMPTQPGSAEMGSAEMGSAAMEGAEPGRIHRLDPSLGPLPRDLALGSTHAFGLAEAVELARTLGLLPRRMAIYAIEAGGFDPGAALSPAVAAAAADATALIVAELREGLADA